MTSLIGHLFIVVLYFIYPNNFNFYALFIGSIFPDIEYIIKFMFDIYRKKINFNIINLKKYYINSEVGLLHSILGSFFITLPYCIILLYIFNKIEGFFIAFYSLLIAIFSHLLIDLPGHKKFILFYPYIIEKNPFLFKKRIRFLEKFYPWKNIEKKSYQVVYEYNWFIVSHFFLILSIIIFLIYFFNFFNINI